jgi:hypothetical protein
LDTLDFIENSLPDFMNKKTGFSRRERVGERQEHFAHPTLGDHRAQQNEMSEEYRCRGNIYVKNAKVDPSKSYRIWQSSLINSQCIV